MMHQIEKRDAYSSGKYLPLSDHQKVKMMSDFDESPLTEQQADKTYNIVQNNLLCNKGKELQRFIKRENEIREIFNMSTEEIRSFTTFEQAEQFVMEVVNYPDTMPLTANYRKIRQLYLLRDRGQNEDGKTDYVISDVHYISGDSLVDIQLINI